MTQFHRIAAGVQSCAEGEAPAEPQAGCREGEAPAEPQAGIRNRVGPSSSAGASRSRFLKPVQGRLRLGMRHLQHRSFRRPCGLSLRLPCIGLVLVLPALVLSVEATAADPPSTQATPPTQAMRDRVTALQLRAGDRRIAPATDPLLRYTDPARATTDGTVWAFGETGRPTALLTLFSEPVPFEENLPGATRWTYEFVTLSETPLRATGPGDWTWHPGETDLRLRDLPTADPPAKEERLRGRQMRLLARRFAVREVFRTEAFELRMMDRPTLRYTDTARGIDGALIAFAYGTNPEAFLLLEADTAGGGWKYGFARMGAAELVARLDGQQVWRVEGYDSAHESAADPYHAFFDTEP